MSGRDRMKNLKNKKIFMFLFVFLLAFPLGALSSNYILQKAPIEEMVLQGGVIRLQNSGPTILSNTTHVSVGLKNVSINEDGNLVIIRDLQNSSLVSVDVTLDEDLASRGITCGTSGGGYKTIILFYNKDGKKLDLNHTADYLQVSGPYANFFISYIGVNTDYVSQFLPQDTGTTENVLEPPVGNTQTPEGNTQANNGSQTQPK